MRASTPHTTLDSLAVQQGTNERTNKQMKNAFSLITTTTTTYFPTTTPPSWGGTKEQNQTASWWNKRERVFRKPGRVLFAGTTTFGFGADWFREIVSSKYRRRLGVRCFGAFFEALDPNSWPCWVGSERDGGAKSKRERKKQKKMH